MMLAVSCSDESVAKFSPRLSACTGYSFPALLCLEYRLVSTRSRHMELARLYLLQWLLRLAWLLQVSARLAA